MMSDRALDAPPGAYFGRDDEGGVVFTFVMDASSKIGPRKATAADQADHPEAWAAFCDAEGVGALDRDAQDGDGGSLKQPRRRKVSREPAVPDPKGS